MVEWSLLENNRGPTHVSTRYGKQSPGHDMDRLGAMRLFVAVAETGSFSSGAQRVGLSKSVASKQIKALEDHLGARLINRTTRRLNLTEVGTAYAERCRRLLADLDETEASVSRLHADPRGVLRINAPMSFGQQHLAPLLAEFLRRYPHIELDLNLNDRRVDLLEEGVDVAIRIGELEDSSLIARKLSETELVACASTDYVAQQGLPGHPDELARHPCLGYSLRAGRDVWRFRRDGEEVSVNVQGPLRVNNGDTLRVAALAGLGIVLSPCFISGADLQAGRLVRVVPEWRAATLGIYAVYPPHRYLSAKVRAMVDFLRDHVIRGKTWQAAA